MARQTKTLTESTELDIVFLHGWGMNQGIWQGFSQLFRDRYSTNLSVKCLDLPGYGTQHNKTLDEYSLERVSNWVADKLNKPSILVGWSMGGLIAQYLASHQHKYALAHVQIASTPKFLEEPDWPGIKPNVLSIFAKQLQIDHDILLRRFLALQNMGLEKPKFSVNTMLGLLTQYEPSTKYALEQSLNLLNSSDLRQQLELSNIPCLRIYGKLDGLVPIKVVDKIDSLCINSEVSIIDKASHAPFLSHPEATFESISTFLETAVGLSRPNSSC